MRTERNVMIAASRSRPECNASERTPKLPVRTTKNVLRETNSRAEPTLSSAARFFSRPSSIWLIISIARLDYLNSPHSPARAAHPRWSSLFCRNPLSHPSASDSSRGTCLRSKDNVLSRWEPGDRLMIRRASLSIVLAILFAACCRAQAPAPPAAASVWKALSSPAMDPAKSAHTENVEIVRDREHITLLDGTIQFAQPVNGVTFGAANDDFYSKRQKDREDLGESSVPRLLQAVLSADRVRTAYFLADLKVAGKDWVEIHEDAMEPEEMGVGRWVDVGPAKIFDAWMSFPAGGKTSAEAWKDPQGKEDFSIHAYHINAAVSSGAELSATTRVDIEPRLSGQGVLIFDLDSNLRLDSIKDSKGNALGFYQSRENKDRYQSYGNYVAVVLAQPLQIGEPQSLEFHYAGKRAIRKAGSGNYFCESSGWYPERPNSFSARA